MKCLSEVDLAALVLLSMFAGWLLFPITSWLFEKIARSFSARG